MITSTLLILGLGMVACRLSERVRLPGLLALILLGMGLGSHSLGLLGSTMLSLSSDVCTMALILILLRAGLGLDRRALNRSARATLGLGLLPFLLEAFVILVATHLLLELSLLEAAMAGIILAAAAPAVIVPAMLILQEQGIGTGQHVPAMVLTANALENVLAVTLFGALTAWSATPAQTAWTFLTWVPLQIVGGLALGAGAGYLLSLALKLKAVDRPVERLCLVLSGAIGIALAGQSLGVAAYAGVMALGLMLRERTPQEAAHVARTLDPVWYVAQIFLFTLIGAQADPRRIVEVGLFGLGLVALGLLARTLGVQLALSGTHLESKERAFCAVALAPKATVQAAIGGVPLALGLASGNTILALAVLAIVVTGPLGAYAIDKLAPRWLLLTEPEREVPASVAMVAPDATAD